MYVRKYYILKLFYFTIGPFPVNAVQMTIDDFLSRVFVMLYEGLLRIAILRHKSADDVVRRFRFSQYESDTSHSNYH